LCLPAGSAAYDRNPGLQAQHHIIEPRFGAAKFNDDIGFTQPLRGELVAVVAVHAPHNGTLMLFGQTVNGFAHFAVTQQPDFCKMLHCLIVQSGAKVRLFTLLQNPNVALITMIGSTEI
jgi:hypothetical protein